MTRSTCWTRSQACMYYTPDGAYQGLLAEQALPSTSRTSAPGGWHAVGRGLRRDGDAGRAGRRAAHHVLGHGRRRNRRQLQRADRGGADGNVYLHDDCAGRDRDRAGRAGRRLRPGGADAASFSRSGAPIRYTTRRSPSGRTARCTPSRAAARGACACFDTQGGLLREGIGAAVLLCRAGVIGGRAGWLDLRRRARDRRDLSFCARRRAVGALRPVAVRPVRAGSCRPVVIAIRAGRLLRDCRAGGAQRCGMSSPPTPTQALRSWCESASTERSTPSFY